MPQSIMAVYEHGLFRPLEPLTLPESQQVRIQILSEPVVDEVDHAIQSLVDAGSLTLPSHQTKPPSISKAGRQELADALAQGAKKTLSEIVIEDRGQW